MAYVRALQAQNPSVVMKVHVDDVIVCERLNNPNSNVNTNGNMNSPNNDTNTNGNMNSQDNDTNTNGNMNNENDGAVLKSRVVHDLKIKSDGKMEIRKRLVVMGGCNEEEAKRRKLE